MQRPLDRAVRAALGRLQIRFEYHDRSSTYTAAVPIDARGITLIGLHVNEADGFLRMESTIFRVPAAHEVRVALELLEASLRFVHLRMLERHVLVELDLDLSYTGNLQAHIEQSFYRFVSAIERIYPELLVATQLDRPPKSRPLRKIQLDRPVDD